MTDTGPEVARRYRELLLARSGQERLRMGGSMHATARALVRASVLAGNPLASAADLRRALFLRFYGPEFDAESRDRIVTWLGRDAPAPRGAPGAPPPPTTPSEVLQPFEIIFPVQLRRLAE
jgi:squalene cyclase